MSLNYDYIFSQIDKAKKKRKRWTQADTDAAAKKLAEEKEAREPTVSQHRYKDPKDRKPGEKPSTYTKPLEGKGRVTGGKPGGEKTNRGKRKLVGEKLIADVGTENEGKIHRGTDRKGLKRDYAKEQANRDAAKKKKEEEEKDKKQTFTGKPYDFPKGHSTQEPTTHRRYRTVIDAKGNKVSVPVTMKPSDTEEKTEECPNCKGRGKVRKKPTSRRGQLRTESGAYSVKDPVEGNKRLAEADRKYTKERNTVSLQSYMDYLQDKKPKKKKKKKKEDGTEASDDDFEPDYSSLVSDDDGDTAPTSDNDDDSGPINKSLWKSWLKEKAEEDMEEILAERRSRNAHRAGNTPKKFLADRFRDYLVADIERQEENRPKKMTEEQLEEKKRKKTTHTKELINAKRRKTGYNIRSRRKAEEGIGGMNMGSQRGLGHDAGYKQDPGESAQITEVKGCDCKDPKCKDPKCTKKKSGYQTDQQDESPDSQPNKQQIPASKPGMDTLKMYKKALIIKYNNIYKPANI